MEYTLITARSSENEIDARTIAEPGDYYVAPVHVFYTESLALLLRNDPEFENRTVWELRQLSTWAEKRKRLNIWDARFAPYRFSRSGVVRADIEAKLNGTGAGKLVDRLFLAAGGNEAARPDVELLPAGCSQEGALRYKEQIEISNGPMWWDLGYICIHGAAQPMARIALRAAYIWRPKWDWVIARGRKHSTVVCPAERTVFDPLYSYWLGRGEPWDQKPLALAQQD